MKTLRATGTHVVIIPSEGKTDDDGRPISDGGIYLRDGSTDVPVVVHEVEQFVFDDQTVLIEDLDVSVPVIGTTGDDTLDGTRNGSEAAMVTILSVPAVALIPSTGATARIPSVSPMPPANLLPSPAK